MYIVNRASSYTHEEALFVSLDDLDNISFLLQQENDSEEEIAHLFNEVSTFMVRFWKKAQPIRL